MAYYRVKCDRQVRESVEVVVEAESEKEAYSKVYKALDDGSLVYNYRDVWAEDVNAMPYSDDIKDIEEKEIIR